MSLSTGQLMRVALAYSVEYESLVAIASGYRNISHMFYAKDGRAYNFILYKNEPGIVERIQRINRLGRHLSDTPLPVRVPIDARILALKSGDSIRYGSLYSCLPGSTIAWEMYSMKHIKLLGQAVGLVHESMSDYYDDLLPSVHEQSKLSHEQMEEYFSREGVIRAMRTKLGVAIKPGVFPMIRDTLIIASKCQAVQPLHLDMVRGNLLFGKANADSHIAFDQLAVTGIVDFEKAAVGPVVFDLARSLSFLYVDCDKPEQKSKKYFIDSGYIKRAGREIGPEGLAQLEPLVSFYLMYDLYKFLSQNPYEALTDNHHYRRTRDILLQRQLIY